MKVPARNFYRTAMIAFSHACDHASAESEKDAIQIVVSLDYGVEMLLKAVVLEQGESIMSRGGHTITLSEAHKKCGPYVNSPTIELLRVGRDNLQHSAGYAAPETSRDFLEGTLLFVEEVLEKEFSLSLPPELATTAQSRPPEMTKDLTILSESPQLQRDISADPENKVVVWAEADAGSQNLGVYYMKESGSPTKLTPVGGFEYMPRTDGEHVVAYRQSGGVVLYNLMDGSRNIISETGGPTSIAEGYIGAQGLSVTGGLGGGVWLYSMVKKKWEQLDENGDSIKISGDRAVWQVFDTTKEAHQVKQRALVGGKTTIIAENMAHPSPSGSLIAYQEWGGKKIHVVDNQGKQIYQTTGFFPLLNDKLLSYYEGADNDYTLKVTNIETGQTLLSLSWVGFPMGGSGYVDKNTVYFESRAGRDVHAVWKAHF